MYREERSFVFAGAGKGFSPRKKELCEVYSKEEELFTTWRVLCRE